MRDNREGHLEVPATCSSWARLEFSRFTEDCDAFRMLPPGNGNAEQATLSKDMVSPSSRIMYERSGTIDDPSFAGKVSGDGLSSLKT